MPVLEMTCQLYSSWARKDMKWVTTNADENTDILLSLLSAEDDTEEEDDTWTVLVLLVNQDVLQRIPLSPWSASAGGERITLLGGESSLLVMAGQNYKWRVELQAERYLVEIFDRVRGMGLERAEVMCLASWQKDITMGLVKDWLSETEYSKVREEMLVDSDEVLRVEHNSDLLEMVENVLRGFFLNSDTDCSDTIENNDSDDLLDISKDLLDAHFE